MKLFNIIRKDWPSASSTTVSLTLGRFRIGVGRIRGYPGAGKAYFGRTHHTVANPYWSFRIGNIALQFGIFPKP